jgi:hypothetical protein
MMRQILMGMGAVALALMPVLLLTGAVSTGPAGTGSGSVTSVALTMPAGFTVANSPVTGAGSLDVTTPGPVVTNGYSAALALSNTVTLGKHLISVAAVPTVVTNAGAGSGTGTIVVDAAATDVKGMVTLITGASPGASPATILTLTFNTAYGIAPVVFLAPTDNTTRAVGLFVASSGTTTFTVQAAITLAASTTYHFNYFVMQ